MGVCDSSGKKKKENDDLLDRQKKILNDDNDISIQNLTDHIVEENTNISEPEVEIKNNNNEQKPAVHVYNPKNLESVKYDPNLFKSSQSNFGESSQVEIFYKGQILNYSNVIDEKNINNNKTRKLNDGVDTNNENLFSKSVTGFSFNNKPFSLFKDNKTKIEINPLKSKSLTLSSYNRKRNIININNDNENSINMNDRDSFNDGG